MTSKKTKTRNRVLQAIVDAGSAGVSDQQIARATGLRGSTVRPRRCELAAAGLIIPRRHRRRNERGIPVTVWVATPGVEPENSLLSPHKSRRRPRSKAGGLPHRETCNLDSTCDRCGHDRFVFFPIHNGRSTRVDCARCGKMLQFATWNPPSRSTPK